MDEFTVTLTLRLRHTGGPALTPQQVAEQIADNVSLPMDRFGALYPSDSAYELTEPVTFETTD